MAKNSAAGGERSEISVRENLNRLENEFLVLSEQVSEELSRESPGREFEYLVDQKNSLIRFLQEKISVNSCEN